MKHVQPWLQDLRLSCTAAATSGAKACEWGSGQLWGCGREVAAELVKQLREGLVGLGFAQVEWWHGPLVGWAVAPGTCCVAEKSGQNVSSWGFAARLRISWGRDGASGSGSGSRGGGGRSDQARASRQIEECTICNEDGVRRAVLQPCGHQFCRHCARRLPGRACPRCGTSCSGVRDVPTPAASPGGSPTVALACASSVSGSSPTAGDGWSGFPPWGSPARSLQTASSAVWEGSVGCSSPATVGGRGDEPLWTKASDRTALPGTPVLSSCADGSSGCSRRTGKDAQSLLAAFVAANVDETCEEASRVNKEREWCKRGTRAASTAARRSSARAGSCPPSALRSKEASPVHDAREASRRPPQPPQLPCQTPPRPAPQSRAKGPDSVASKGPGGTASSSHDVEQSVPQKVGVPPKPSPTQPRTFLPPEAFSKAKGRGLAPSSDQGAKLLASNEAQISMATLPPRSALVASDKVARDGNEQQMTKALRIHSPPSALSERKECQSSVPANPAASGETKEKASKESSSAIGEETTHARGSIATSVSTVKSIAHDALDNEEAARTRGTNSSASSRRISADAATGVDTAPEAVASPSALAEEVASSAITPEMVPTPSSSSGAADVAAEPDERSSEACTPAAPVTHIEPTPASQENVLQDVASVQKESIIEHSASSSQEAVLDASSTSDTTPKFAEQKPCFKVKIDGTILASCGSTDMEECKLVVAPKPSDDEQDKIVESSVDKVSEKGISSEVGEPADLADRSEENMHNIDSTPAVAEVKTDKDDDEAAALGERVVSDAITEKEERTNHVASMQLGDDEQHLLADASAGNVSEKAGAGEEAELADRFEDKTLNTDHTPAVAEVKTDLDDDAVAPRSERIVSSANTEMEECRTDVAPTSPDAKQVEFVDTFAVKAGVKDITSAVCDKADLVERLAEETCKMVPAASLGEVNGKTQKEKEETIPPGESGAILASTEEEACKNVSAPTLDDDELEDASMRKVSKKGTKSAVGQVAKPSEKPEENIGMGERWAHVVISAQKGDEQEGTSHRQSADAVSAESTERHHGEVGKLGPTPSSSSAAATSTDVEAEAVASRQKALLTGSRTAPRDLWEGGTGGGASPLALSPPKLKKPPSPKTMSRTPSNARAPLPSWAEEVGEEEDTAVEDCRREMEEEEEVPPCPPVFVGISGDGGANGGAQPKPSTELEDCEYSDFEESAAPTPVATSSKSSCMASGKGSLPSEAVLSEEVRHCFGISADEEEAAAAACEEGVRCGDGQETDVREERELVAGGGFARDSGAHDKDKAELDAEACSVLPAAAAEEEEEQEDAEEESESPEEEASSSATASPLSRAASPSVGASPAVVTARPRPAVLEDFSYSDFEESVDGDSRPCSMRTSGRDF